MEEDRVQKIRGQNMAAEAKNNKGRGSMNGGGVGLLIVPNTKPAYRIKNRPTIEWKIFFSFSF
jgi:hypothetical protein